MQGMHNDGQTYRSPRTVNRFCQNEFVDIHTAIWESVLAGCISQWPSNSIKIALKVN